MAGCEGKKVARSGGMKGGCLRLSLLGTMKAASGCVVTVLCAVCDAVKWYVCPQTALPLRTPSLCTSGRRVERMSFASVQEAGA